MEEDRLVLVGHSLGGGIALLAALQLASRGIQDRLAGLVLVSAAVYPQRFPPYISLARIPGVGELFLLAPPPLWSVRRGLRAIVCDPGSNDDEQVRIQRSPYLSFERRRSLLRSARAIDPHVGERTSEQLRGMRVPTLLLWGEEDPVIPVAFGRRLARELPSARLVTLPRVGHLPPEESPSASLAPVLEFMKELDARGSGL
jgi:pimeloyl-ACP methyl ester carboxylesterase